MNETVTRDALLDGRVILRQPADGYRVAIDPVLLAAAIAARDGQRVLEVGIGTGAASLCLAWRVPGCRVTGIELQLELAQLARENAAANGLSDRIAVIEGDLAEPPAEIAAGSFDHVYANPPHLEAGRGRPSPAASQAAANVEGGAGLADWLRFCLAMARPGGSVTLVHRADRIDALVAGLREGAGGIAVLPLWPKAGRAAKRVIVMGRKGSRQPARLLPGLILHAEDGSYTAEAAAVLRDGAGLPL